MRLGFDEADEFVTVVVMDDPFLLFTTKIALNAEGIHCRFTAHDPLGLGERVPDITDGQTVIEVQVREADLERAIQVVSDLDPERGT